MVAPGKMDSSKTKINNSSELSENINRPMNNNSKVLILSHLFYPELVASGQVLTELSEALVDLGVDVEVICGPPTILNLGRKIPRYLEYNGIKIKRVWGASFPKLNFPGMIINHVTYALSLFFHLLFDSSKRPMLVVTIPPFLGAISAIFKKLGRNSYIYLIHDVYPDAAIKLGLLGEKSIISKLWERLNRFIFKQATAIIVIGRCMKEVIINKGEKGDNLSNKIHLIPIWGDENNVQFVKREENHFIKKWGLDGKFVIMYSGNMGRPHDMETIMEAAKGLEEYEDIVFLFIGDGYKKKWMEDYSRKEKLTNCQFHNYVDRNDLRYSISCSHVGLVSLLPGQEGLSVPSKTLTMLSAGVPIIGIMTENNEIASIITENHCGIIVEPGDVKGLVNAIYRLYSDTNLRKLMGKKGREAVHMKYNLKTAAIEYKKIIESLKY